MARNTSGRRLGGLLAILVSGLLLLGAAGGLAVGEEKLGPRRHMLALTNSDRERYERRELAFADHLARYAKAHSQAMACRHSAGANGRILTRTSQLMAVMTPRASPESDRKAM